MKVQTLVVAFLGLSLVTGGCSAVVSQLGDGISQGTQTNSADQKVTVVSSDNTIQLTTSAEWKSDDINEAEAQQHVILKLSTQHGNLQVQVMAVPKAEGMNMDILKTAVNNSAEAIVGQEGTVTPTSLTTLNGMASTQYEGRGKFAGKPVGVLSTGVDASDSYYNILVVGYESNFDQMRDEINQLVQSFQPVQAEQS